ncbi:MAG TPA: DNA replication/repair protein RecF [Geobacteraceae bacterium]|nr:DNA replication/repair protein RecF [Geobacteraceae bacterium]
MKLVRIQIHSFRNISHADLRPSERFNIIVGNNAQGKTNLLEAIYLLGTMKSFRMARNSELITYDSPYSHVKGWGIRDGVERGISLTITHSGKKASIDGKPVLRLADFFGKLNMVVFSPEDISMVRGLPEVRRRYLDRAVFSIDTGYLGLHHDYFRILKNRNALLKQGLRDGLSVWTDKLADAGSRLIEKRASFVRELAVLLRNFYAAIAGTGQEATVTYRSRCAELTNASGSLRQRLHEALERGIADEIRRGTTLTGPHRDDLEFSLNGKPLNHHGSQGEQRSFILALKMAEIEYMKVRWGNPPVLLLDDMTSELDRDRNGNFMSFLREKEMQVFITTTGLENINLSGITDYSTFPVRDGRFYTEVAHVR